jgi:hypothetical protein
MEFSDARALLDQVNEALAAYDPILKERARDILLEKAFGINAPPRQGNASTLDKNRDLQSERRGEKSPSFDSLLERWTPTMQQDLALLGAYYFNVLLGQDSVSGAEINRILKDHGRGSKNITQDLGAHISSQPSLILQVKKSGNSRQARKLYKITSPGIKYVEARLNPASDPENGGTIE